MRKAVVIGAGISGLLAARVLNEEFDQVFLIDRDFLGISGKRRGVAQAQHLHVLLQRGRQILEELFPGLDAELAAAGAPEIDWSGDTAWLSRYGWFPRGQSPIITRSCSRTLLEDHVRARVLSLKNISCIERAEAVGIRLRSGKSDSASALLLADGKEIEADLLIDSSGRTSRIMESDKVSQSVDASIGYSSCLMEIPKSALRDFKQLYIQMRPPLLNRGGVMIPQEGGLYRVTLIGAGGDHPPTDEKGFLEFAKTLADPSFYRIIRESRFASPLSAYRRTAGHRLSPEKSAFPKNLFVIGDAQCAFNPVYGQGMTAAAITAQILKSSLKNGTVDSAAFHRGTQAATRYPWILGTSEDMRVASIKTDGVGPIERGMARALHLFTNSVIKKAVRDPSTHRRFLKVLHMIDSPTSLVTGLLR